MAWEQVVRLRDHAPVELSRPSRWRELWLSRWQFAYAVAGLVLGAVLVIRSTWSHKRHMRVNS